MIRVTQLRVPAGSAELAADRLWAAGAAAVEERADGDRAVLRSVLAADDAVSAQRLGPLPAGWELSFFDQDPTPLDTWRDYAAPIEASPTLTIAPAWVPGVAPSPAVVAIEPGSAFGLGDHPTTRLSAAAAERLCTGAGRVLDVGCGSGVLAIVAARRGARDVVAIDVAEAAREATEANAARNGVAVAVSTTPLADVPGTFDVVLANILAPTLVALADDLRRVTADDGVLVISGILDGAHDHVLAALAPLVPVRTEVLDGWACVELRYRPASAASIADARG